MRRWSLSVIVVCLCGIAPVRGERPVLRTATAPEAAFFETRIRPVLADHCWRCHGPKKQMAGLRLDFPQSLLTGGDSGPAVKPGDPDGSLLLQAVRHTGDLKMPPRKKLAVAALDDLAAWVKQGAFWPAATAATNDAEAWKRHWAFQPVRAPNLPAVKDARWPQTAVDAFVLAKLEEKGLTPSASADRRTLLRRVTFDLTGLPPTPEELDTFLKDESADAWTRVVDRLLASPHYGERWGRYWLDVARYADTKGYVFFQDANFPWGYTYRDYVIEAFNHDLPCDRFLVEQIAADRLPLGDDKQSLRALGFLACGGRFMNNVHDIHDDRIDVVCRGLLGLTVTCARCHDHKFDPIPTQDYYSLYGVFASCVEPEVPPLYQPPPSTPQYAAFAKELGEREKKLNDFLDGKRAALIHSARTRAAEYLLAAHALRDRPATEDFMLIADGNDLNPTMIVRWKSFLDAARKRKQAALVHWHALAALPEKDFAEQAAVLCTLLAKSPPQPVNPVVAETFAATPPRTFADVAKVYAELLKQCDSPMSLPESAREELRRVLHGPGAPADPAPHQIDDLQLLPDRPSQSKLQELRKAVEQWRIEGPGSPPRATVLLDAPQPNEPRVFLRGNPARRGEAVPRQFLGVLSGEKRQPFTDGSGRLELAQAIASRDNPLTARVLVNRVWMHHFGRPLVSTPSDFGLRSEPPTHPALLDHLATFFLDSGWSLKKLHRHMLLSAAYRQRSDDRVECRKADPENVLLWRAHRRRVDFEAMRDALLAVSGRLDRSVGGPSVKDAMSPGATRRTLYTFVDRLQVPPLLRAFDFPSPDATAGQRDVTTVPQQALFMMNNPFVLENARGVLKRSEVAAEKETAGKVVRLYRLLFGRAPAADELALALEYIGEKPAALAWERYIQALLLSNEFVFID